MDVKKPTTFDEQIDILCRRGCIVNDRDFAKKVLNSINYYRLTAYFLPFKNCGDMYSENLTLEKVYNIYEFDKKLRNLIFTVVEDIEITLRVQIAYYHAHKYGALGYLDEVNYNSHHKHAELLRNIDEYKAKNKKQLFVKHHIDQYGNQFPIWVIIELFSMGQLSIFYSDMLTPDKKYIAKNVFKINEVVLDSWLNCITSLRNHCAHYSRLYYYHFPRTPTTLKNSNYTIQNYIFDYILVLKHLYRNIGNWASQVFIPLQTLIDEYEQHIELSHMNFPDNWFELLK